MAKVIACAHEKGGVGKTTTTINPGIGLVRQDKKVLLLDADPQGDLTKCLGVKDPKELRHTIASCMDYIIAHGDEDGYTNETNYTPGWYWDSALRCRSKLLRPPHFTRQNKEGNMNAMLGFFIGLSLGGSFGFLTAALLAAGSDRRNEPRD